MRLSGVLLGSALLAACSQAPADGPVTVSEAQNRSRVAVPVGETLTVRLRSNGTTGYLWRVEAAPPALRLVGDSFAAPEQPASGPPVTGGEGVHTFVFRATQPGSGRLVLAERPPWAPQDPAAGEFTLTVRATAKR